MSDERGFVSQCSWAYDILAVRTIPAGPVERISRPARPPSENRDILRRQPPIRRAFEAIRSCHSVGANLDARCGRLWAGNRDEDDHAIVGPDCSGDVTLAGEVFGQFDAARSDLNRLSSG